MHTPLAYPETFPPTSFMKGYFLVRFLATAVIKSLFGLGLMQNICAVRTRKISFRTGGFKVFLCSSSVGCWIHAIMERGAKNLEWQTCVERWCQRCNRHHFIRLKGAWGRDQSWGKRPQRWVGGHRRCNYGAPSNVPTCRSIACRQTVGFTTNL